MSDTVLDIEALRKQFLGQESPPTTMEVERGHIRAFADAIDDPNLLWRDEAQARQTRFGGVVSPPTFLRALRTERLEQLPPELSLNRLLDGGSEWEYFDAVKPGDRITAVNRITDLYTRTGSLGAMVFVVTETTYTNHLDQLVATQKNTSIRY